MLTADRLRARPQEVCMQTQTHPLEAFFHQAVRNSYEGQLGLNDPDITGYVAQLLCAFAESDKLYRMHDSMGRAITMLDRMIDDADPVLGTAPSFDAERARRKHIGDYSLFVAGMFPEAAESRTRLRRNQPSRKELIHAGKESYYIVSQFNLFEYEQEAPLFARLSDSFERCIQGLTLVRDEFFRRKPFMLGAGEN
jgi:hypothetical protein